MRFGAVAFGEEQLVPLCIHQAAAVGRPGASVRLSITEATRLSAKNGQGPERAVEGRAGLVGNEKRVAIGGDAHDLHAESRSSDGYDLPTSAGDLADWGGVADDRRRK